MQLHDGSSQGPNPAHERSQPPNRRSLRWLNPAESHVETAAYRLRWCAPMKFLLIALALLGGCMVGDPTMPVDDDLPPAQSEASLANNPRTAFNYFVSKGLTQTQAAGIVGNLMQESSVMPTAVQPGGPGRGIAQWSVGGRFNV